MTKEVLPGFTFRGQRHTQTARDKMSKAHSGIPHSEAHNNSIAKALRGKQRPKEVVEKLSTVWNIVMPLVLRGGVAIEIEGVTDFSRLQIINAMNRKRSSLFSVCTTPQQKREAKSKSHTLSWRERNGNFSQENKKISEIAKSLVAEGLFTDELEDYIQLEKFYEKNKRALPESLSLRLCCEVYLAARRQDKGEILDRYIEIIKSARKQEDPLCPEPLAVEQKFIIERVRGKFEVRFFVSDLYPNSTIAEDAYRPAPNAESKILSPLCMTPSFIARIIAFGIEAEEKLPSCKSLKNVKPDILSSSPLIIRPLA